MFVFALAVVSCATTNWITFHQNNICTAHVRHGKPCEQEDRFVSHRPVRRDFFFYCCCPYRWISPNQSLLPTYDIKYGIVQ